MYPFFSPGIIVITDGVFCMPDASLFDALLNQVRNLTISISFLHLTSKPIETPQSPSLTPESTPPSTPSLNSCRSDNAFESPEAAEASSPTQVGEGASYTSESPLVDPHHPLTDLPHLTRHAVKNIAFLPDTTREDDEPNVFTNIKDSAGIANNNLLEVREEVIYRHMVVHQKVNAELLEDHERRDQERLANGEPSYKELAQMEAEKKRLLSIPCKRCEEYYSRREFFDDEVLFDEDFLDYYTSEDEGFVTIHENEVSNNESSAEDYSDGYCSDSSVDIILNTETEQEMLANEMRKILEFEESMILYFFMPRSGANLKPSEDDSFTRENTDKEVINSLPVIVESNPLGSLVVRTHRFRRRISTRNITRPSARRFIRRNRPNGRNTFVREMQNYNWRGVKELAAYGLQQFYGTSHYGNLSFHSLSTFGKYTKFNNQLRGLTESYSSMIETIETEEPTYNLLCEEPYRANIRTNLSATDCNSEGRCVDTADPWIDSGNEHCGLVPYTDLLKFLASSTGGVYMDTMPQMTEEVVYSMSPSHRAFLTWSFQQFAHQLAPDCSESATVSKSQQLNMLEKRPRMRVRERSEVLSCTVRTLLSCRLREGYSVKVVDESGAVYLVLPWKYGIMLHYTIRTKCKTPLSLATASQLHMELSVEAPYEFLVDIERRDPSHRGYTDGGSSHYRNELAYKYQVRLGYRRV